VIELAMLEGRLVMRAFTNMTRGEGGDSLAVLRVTAASQSAKKAGRALGGFATHKIHATTAHHPAADAPGV